MHPNRLEVMRETAPFIAEKLPMLLRDVEASWQPTDFLPKLDSEEGFEELRALRAEAERMPEDALAVLVGDMITEEALPTYTSWIFQVEGIGNAYGDDLTPWSAWNRGWCAEENRHGDLLNRYLYLTGRIDMREVEVTIHHLINDGGDVQAENDPYRTYVYTSFQEIATRVSHLNVGKLARAVGAERLGLLCARIAGDEQRHARAFKLYISKFLELDPSEVVLAFQDMMKKKITMPAMWMRESGGERGDAFEKFERVAGRLGVYTPQDYLNIMSELIRDWKIAELRSLTPAAEAAQDYLCRLPERYSKIVERYMVRQEKQADDEPIEFSWLLPRRALSQQR